MKKEFEMNLAIREGANISCAAPIIAIPLTLHTSKMRHCEENAKHSTSQSQSCNGEKPLTRISKLTNRSLRNSSLSRKGRGEQLIDKIFSLFTFHFSRKRFAFTLAEVLITLGIIGVVAAMTIPTLIQNYRNHVVETKLKHFVSLYNQAIKMVEAEQGDKDNWFENVDNPSGVSSLDESTVYKWYTEYTGKYIKSTKIECNKRGCPLVYLPNGSAFNIISNRGIDFYTNINDIKSNNIQSGVNLFHFRYFPKDTNNSWKNNSGHFSAYKYGWNGINTNVLYKGMNLSCENSGMYCAAIIEANGWKIPKDYPFKVR